MTLKPDKEYTKTHKHTTTRQSTNNGIMTNSGSFQQSKDCGMSKNPFSSFPQNNRFIEKITYSNLELLRTMDLLMASASSMKYMLTKSVQS